VLFAARQEKMKILKKKKAIERKRNELVKCSTLGSFTESDLGKLCGSIRLKEDPIEIQKKMREEWERSYLQL